MNQKVFTVDEIKKKMEYYCSYQDRCHQEVEKKLSTFRLIPEAKELILIHLIQHDFLNEQRFAQNFARGKFRIKKWGRKKIIDALRLLNITDYTINYALEQLNEQEYLLTLHALALKKLNNLKEKEVYLKYQKVYQYLYRQGFEPDRIQEVIKKIKKEPN